MPILISDREVAFGPDNQPVVVTGKPLFVVFTPTQTPLWVRDSQGYEQDQSAGRKPPVDGVLGTWQTSLPRPSETRNGPVLWTCRRLDGTILQGVVPEGIPGPVSLDYLLFGLPSDQAWQVVRAGQAPAQVVATSPGVPGVPYDITPYGVSAAYTYGHAVTWRGSTFMALRSVPAGVAPPFPAISNPYWLLLSEAGGAPTTPPGTLMFGTSLAYGRVAVAQPLPGLLGVPLI